MTVNPLHCSLSSWSGLEGYCRWCNFEIPDGIAQKRKWCSGKCLELWRLQHRYFLSRQFVMKLARGRCLCLRAPNEQRHAICAGCGSCEVVVRLRGEIMTCDHVIPRFGNKSKFSCIHHVNNLQVLCSRCHDIKSKNDEIKYGL